MNLICCTCGGVAKGRQWWNRDKGYGVCPTCFAKLEVEMGQAEAIHACGRPGVHHSLDPNWDCGGAGPHTPGEVRRLPRSTNPDNGADILCRACFIREIKYRQDRNRELEPDCRYQLPTWESLNHESDR